MTAFDLDPEAAAEQASPGTSGEAAIAGPAGLEPGDGVLAHPAAGTRTRESRHLAALCALIAALLLVTAVVGVRARPPAADRAGSREAVTASSAARTIITVRGARLADPFVLSTTGGALFAYGTNLPGHANVPVLRSSGDLRVWEPVGDALPRLPRWANDTGFTTWAPAVAEVPGGYRMYYVTRSRHAAAQCISTAFSRRASGPFADATRAPLICQRSQGGSIDPSPYQVGNRRFLVWKSEGTRPGTRPAVWAQRLTADGRRLVGRPARLLTPTLPWQNGIVEGPAMLVRDGDFVLFYSAGRWRRPDYATGVATCDGPLGPCVPAPSPLLRSGAAGVGLGGAEPFQDRRGAWWLALHTWGQGAPTLLLSGVSVRSLVLAPLTFTGQPLLTRRSDIRVGQVR